MTYWRKDNTSLCFKYYFYLAAQPNQEFEVSDECIFIHWQNKWLCVMDEYLLEHPETLNFLETGRKFVSFVRLSVKVNAGEIMIIVS